LAWGDASTSGGKPDAETDLAIVVAKHLLVSFCLVMLNAVVFVVALMLWQVVRSALEAMMGGECVKDVGGYSPNC